MYSLWTHPANPPSNSSHGQETAAEKTRLLARHTDSWIDDRSDGQVQTVSSVDLMQVTPK